MNPKKVNQLVQDIFLQTNNPTVHREVREDPEAYLLSLLNEIKKGLSGVSKYRITLDATVERASFLSHLDEAREKLGEPVLHK